MDSLFSLLIWSVLDFVDFKLVQEDLSSNRVQGVGGVCGQHLAWAQYTHGIPGQPTNQPQKFFSVKLGYGMILKCITTQTCVLGVLYITVVWLYAISTDSLCWKD